MFYTEREQYDERAHSILSSTYFAFRYVSNGVWKADTCMRKKNVSASIECNNIPAIELNTWVNSEVSILSIASSFHNDFCSAFALVNSIAWNNWVKRICLEFNVVFSDMKNNTLFKHWLKRVPPMVKQWTNNAQRSDFLFELCAIFYIRSSYTNEMRFSTCTIPSLNLSVIQNSDI